MQTVIFLTLVAQRALSGVQNGLGYAGSRHRYAASLALAVFSFLGILAAIIANLPAWQKGAAILAFAASQIGIGMVENAFAARQDGESLPKWRSDIHLWENFVTAGFLLGAVLAGVNILLAVLSVYPGLILHRGAVNIGSYFSRPRRIKRQAYKWVMLMLDDPHGHMESLNRWMAKSPEHRATYKRVVTEVGVASDAAAMLQLRAEAETEQPAATWGSPFRIALVAVEHALDHAVEYFSTLILPKLLFLCVLKLHSA